MNKPDVIGAYDSYLTHKNETDNRLRDSQKEDRYSASASGQCSKKIWYEKHHPELKKPFARTTLRTFQVGNLIGNDLDTGSTLFFNSQSGYKKYAEDYIKDDKLNIGGSFDLLLVDQIGHGYLYDYKTANIGSYAKMFGKNRAIDSTSGDHYRFQLGTYAYILENNYKDKYGLVKIEYMALIGFDKNFSNMAEIEVSNKYVDFAKRYWKEAGSIIESSIEPGPSSTVPYNADWDCKYCNFNQYCNNPSNPEYKGNTNEKKIAI
tara:strand:- start:2444 stop:3232 length:789 start_codon:yes stop_codon:yes gene_type:complete